ncbi:GerMN domain-containing protein [Paenibacillus wulumuqiensis]|uniref:GerMN domain-containing protein n=1 Tax=Paenibacillus wulumuqiensis TaxID=1567107 RepID=UPI0006195D08|nr:GerMN domain-containing protein [Paenibacillus wulumuqiensis]
MKKGIYVAIIICALSVLALGCESKPAANTVQGSDPATNKPAAPADTKDKQEENSQEIKVYYSDVQVMQLEPHTQTITFKEDSEKYSATYAALQKGDQKELIPLWENIDLLSAKLEQGTLTLDVHVPDKARMGSSGEILAIDALKKTFFQFDEVKNIQLLVDGKQTDSLMGQAELDNPLTRE